jgi:putative hydrolase of the HAD superfamily
MVIVFDLDDTLYDELDFVKSGFKEIANYLKDEKYYNFMIDIFKSEGSGKIFDKLIDKFGLDVDINKLIDIYRFHKPNITLSSESLNLLYFVKNMKTALISDGHYIMQKNKYEALGLDEFIKYPVFTDFYHTKKPELKPYQMVMDKYKNEENFIYISDNPKKDFIAIKELGWIGIRYKNKIGIYRNFENNTNYEVTNRKDIVDILRKIENE